MNSSQSLPANPLSASSRRAKKPARFFFTGAALVLFVLMFGGFQLFYLHGEAYPGRPLTPPIRSLLIGHGVAMALWMVLFVVQPLLIATGNRRLHMRLGIFAALVAAVATVLGLALGIGAARVNPPELLLWGLNPKQFLAVPIISILIFGGLIATGIWHRRKPQAHRSMMLLGTLAAMPAAMDRIGPIRELYQATFWGPLFGPFFSTLIIGLILVCIDWALNRSLNRWLAIGYAGLVLASAAIMQLATSSLWDGIASVLIG